MHHSHDPPDTELMHDTADTGAATIPGPPVALDGSHRAATAGRIPGNRGIWVGITCVFVEFGVLFMVYFVARAHFPEAFQVGAERLSRLSGTLITLLSLGLGEWFKGVAWLSVLVAAIIWLKAWLVAYYFLEAPLSHTFIRRLIWILIAYAPMALVLTRLFWRQFADLTQL